MLPPLLAQHMAQSEDTRILELILRPEVMVFVVAIVAVLAGAAVKITNMVIRHRAQIEKLRQGFDPDASVDRRSDH
jgi:hypothetical protein